MANFFVVLLVATAIVLIEGVPLSDDVEKVAAGDWPAIHSIIKRDTGSDEENTNEGGQGKHYSHSVSTFYSSSNNNGQLEERGGGIETVDNNGKKSTRYFKLP